MSYSFKSNDKDTFYISFALNTNYFQQNEEIVTNFMNTYNLKDYVQLENIIHTKSNNYMETILTLKMTKKGKRCQAKLLSVLLMRDKSN